MRTLPKILAALAFLSSAAPVFADNAKAGVFAEWLSGDQPECIPLAEVNKAADGSVPLNGDQFQFVRALFVAIPPVSGELPAGDHAALFLDGADRLLAVEWPGWRHGGGVCGSSPNCDRRRRNAFGVTCPSKLTGEVRLDCEKFCALNVRLRFGVPQRRPQPAAVRRTVRACQDRETVAGWD